MTPSDSPGPKIMGVGANSENVKKRKNVARIKNV